jgi:MFS family permease
VTFSVAFISSAYVSAIPEIALDFGGNPTVHTLGLSLFVVGFIVGPFFWAPLSGMYRKACFMRAFSKFSQKCTVASTSWSCPQPPTSPST